MERPNDVCLYVGYNLQQIQVRSDIIKTASPAFASILTPVLHPNGELFQPISYGWLTAVFLPDVDFEAMVVVCNVLHGRDVDPKIMDKEALVRVGILVGRYHLAKAMAYAIRPWFLLANTDLSSSALFQLMFAAYLMKADNAFQDLSRGFIFNSGGQSPLSIPDIVRRHEMGFDLAYTAEQGKTEVRQYIISSLTTDLAGAINESSDFDDAARGSYMQKYYTLLARDEILSLEKIHTRRLKAVVGHLEGAAIEQFRKNYELVYPGDATPNLTSVFFNLLSQHFKRTTDKIATMRGLCRYCVWKCAPISIYQHTMVDHLN